MSVNGNIVRSTNFAYNQGCNLVTGKTCNRPGRKSDSVDCTDILHAEVVGQEGRYITEATAVSCVYDKQKNQYKNR